MLRPLPVLPVLWWVTAPPPVAHGALDFSAAPLQHVPEVLRSTGGAPPTLTQLILDQVRQADGKRQTERGTIYHYKTKVNIMPALDTCQVSIRYFLVFVRSQKCVNYMLATCKQHAS